MNGIELPNTGNITQADNSAIKMAEKGLSGEVVKEVVLPESMEYKTPSYLVDLRKLKSVHIMALKSLQSLARDKEDSTHTIPVYLATQAKVVLIGYGEPYTLYSTLKRLCKLQFGAEVYLNEGDGFHFITDDNVFGLKLDL